MDRKTLISLIVGSISALLLICILLVGILDGIWPWDGITAYNRLITSESQNAAGPKDTTAATETSETATDSSTPSRLPASEVDQQGAAPALPRDDTPVGIEIDGIVITPNNDKKDDGNKDDGNKDEGNKDDGNKDDGNKDDGNKDDDNKDDGNKDDGNKDDGNKDDGNKDDGNKDDGNKDDGNKDDGNKDDGNKDDGNKDENKDYDAGIDFSDLLGGSSR